MKRRIKLDRIIFLIVLICLPFGLHSFMFKAGENTDSIQIEEKQIRVGCIGDSITFGDGVWQTRKKDAWTYVLDRKLPERYHVYNYGVSGATAQFISDNPYVYHEEWDTIHKNPMDVYILMLGTNDSKDHNWNSKRFKKDYTKLVEDILSLPTHPELVIMLPCRVYAPINGMNNDTLKLEVIPIVNSIAKKYDVPVINLYAATEKHPEYFIDGVHPDEAGNKKLAEIIYKKLYN